MISCHQATFLAPLSGISSLQQGELHTSTFSLLFYSCLVYFYLVLFSLYQKHKKISSLVSSLLFEFAFIFVSMSSSTPFIMSPEYEVLTFKQRGAESLKDAWYRINDAQNRSTKRQATTIILRNFYVGVTSWYIHISLTL